GRPELRTNLERPAAVLLSPPPSRLPLMSVFWNGLFIERHRLLVAIVGRIQEYRQRLVAVRLVKEAMRLRSVGTAAQLVLDARQAIEKIGMLGTLNERSFEVRQCVILTANPVIELAPLETESPEIAER